MIKLVLLSLIDQNFAQAADAAQGNPLAQFLPFILIFGVFYFLMIKPQKKKLEEEKKLLDNLEKGAEVYTKSGLLGKIVGITDKVITLEVAEGTKLKILRSQIGGLANKIFEQKPKEA